jgi:hypothetical protein
MEFGIEPRRYLVVTLAIVAILTGLNFLGLYGTFGLGKEGGFGLIDMFKLNAEGNVPTYFSTLLLLTSALLFALVGGITVSKREPFAYRWCLLGLIFLFLSLDEFAQIHELLDEHRRWTDGVFEPSGALIGPWVVAYGALVLAVGVSYLTFYWNLPRRFQIIFGVAAAMYVGAAIGIEMIGATVWVVERASLKFEIINSIEEVLEMTAIALLNYGLLSYLKERSVSLLIRF